MKISKKALLAAALGIAMALPSLAEDDSSALFAEAPATLAPAPADAGATAPAEPGFALDLAGSHEFGYRFPAYADAFDYQGEMRTPYFSSELGLTIRDGDLKLVSDWDAALRPLATDAATGEYGSWDQLVRVRPLENYLSWNPAGFKLAAGYQIFSWGVADKRNPTDNLNPRDYGVGVDADKIPVLAADAVWYPSEALSIEGVFEPGAQESIYPVDFAAEAEAGATKISGTIAYLASLKGASYAVTDSVAGVPLGLEPDNAVAGGRLSYRSSAVDLSISYLYDIDPYYTPLVATVVTPTGAASATVASTISLERERIHRFGLDAKTTLGKYGLWAEACYSLTRNSGASDDYAYRRSKLDYVIGTDLGFGPNDSGYLNLQYIGTWIPGYDDSFYKDLAAGKIADPKEIYERALVESLGLETEGLLQGATLNLKWELGGGVATPQVTAAYVLPFLYDDTNETRYGSLALNPEIDLKPVDSFHVKVGADLAYAWVRPTGGEVKLDTTTDKIGVYTSSNGVYLKVLYKWNYDLNK